MSLKELGRFKGFWCIMQREVKTIVSWERYKTWSEVPSYVGFSHDCFFKGLGSLPKYFDLTPGSQSDSPLHDATVIVDSLLHYAAVR